MELGGPWKFAKDTQLEGVANTRGMLLYRSQLAGKVVWQEFLEVPGELKSPEPGKEKPLAHFIPGATQFCAEKQPAVLMNTKLR